MNKPIKPVPERNPNSLDDDLNAWFVVFILFVVVMAVYLFTSKEVWSEILE